MEEADHGAKPKTKEILVIAMERSETTTGINSVLL
jgi:hypothetical protein